MAPWIPPIVEFFQTISPIASVVTSILLAYLYFTQSQTLEEQRKLSRANQCPYLTGPYNISYDREEERFEIYLTNAGNGAAVDVEIRTMLTIESYYGDDLEGGTFQAHASRDDRTRRSPDNIQPKEEDVRFVFQPNRFYVRVIDKSTDPEGEVRNLGLDDMISFLFEKDVRYANVRFQITYKDEFGERENPFGRKYQLESEPEGFDPEARRPESILSELQ